MNKSYPGPPFIAHYTRIAEKQGGWRCRYHPRTPANPHTIDKVEKQVFRSTCGANVSHLRLPSPNTPGHHQQGGEKVVRSTCPHRKQPHLNVPRSENNSPDTITKVEKNLFDPRPQAKPTTPQHSTHNKEQPGHHQQGGENFVRSTRPQKKNRHTQTIHTQKRTSTNEAANTQTTRSKIIILLVLFDRSLENVVAGPEIEVKDFTSHRSSRIMRHPLSRLVVWRHSIGASTRLASNRRKA